MVLEGIKVTKMKCHCGETVIMREYRMHLEVALTLRDYYGRCPSCGKEIEVRDLDERDLMEQEYVCNRSVMG